MRERDKRKARVALASRPYKEQMRIQTWTMIRSTRFLAARGPDEIGAADMGPQNPNPTFHRAPEVASKCRESMSRQP